MGRGVRGGARGERGVREGVAQLAAHSSSAAQMYDSAGAGWALSSFSRSTTSPVFIVVKGDAMAAAESGRRLP